MKLVKMLARLALAPAAMVAVMSAAIPPHGTATPRQVAAICGAFAAAMVVNLLIVVKEGNK